MPTLHGGSTDGLEISPNLWAHPAAGGGTAVAPAAVPFATEVRR